MNTSTEYFQEGKNMCLTIDESGCVVSASILREEVSSLLVVIMERIEKKTNNQIRRQKPNNWQAKTSRSD